MYGGAIRGGKSYWLLLELLTLAFKHDNSRWLIVRASYTNISRTILVSFRELMGQGFSQYLKKWDGQTLTATFNNGSQIIFMAESYDSDKELNKFRGLEINGAGIDEINEIQEVTFNKIIERSGSWNGAGHIPIKIACTCNPTQGWVKQRFYDKWEHGTLPKGWVYIPAKLTDNPYLSPEYVESLKNNMPDFEYQVFVEGRWDVKLEGVLFGYSDLKRFSMKDFKAENVEAILGYIDVMDDGVDSLAFPIGYVFKNKVFITDVVFTSENIDSTLPQCVSLLESTKVFEQVGNKPILKREFDYVRVEANNQGGGFIRLLRQFVEPSKVLSVKNTTNKNTRIIMNYGFIKNYFYFRDDYEPNSQYAKFMNEVMAYMKDGSSKKDDAPDSLAGLSKFIQSMLPHLFKLNE